MDFNEMIEAHEKSGAEITVATQPVNAKEATSFGILKTDENSLISSFTEKPNTDQLQGWESPVSEDMQREGRHYLASMGIYVFNRDLLVKLMDEPTKVDFGKEIIPDAIEKHRTLGYHFEGYWTDIGNIDSFFEANIGLTDDIPKFNLYDNMQRIYTNARILPTSKISGTVCDKTVISEGCIIHASKIERSVIGIRSRIGKESSIINCYMMGSDYYESLEDVETHHIDTWMGVGERCFLKNVIIDKNCRIGDDVKINGGKHLKDVETDEYVIKDGIVVIKKGAVIPKGTVIN
jgi:glucose-1-phosphate adenylyltransferase